VDGEVGHGRRHPVLIDALFSRRPQGNRNQRRELVRFGLLAAGEQERAEATADRG